MKPETLLSDDGSFTLYLPEMDETYHSRRGARTESQYVYLEKGLMEIPVGDIRILEFGFGTGLNAQLVRDHARENRRHIEYYSAEAFPLEEVTWKQIDPGQDGWDELHRSEWGQMNKLDAYFSLYKFRGDFRETPIAPQSADLVFYDAFAPAKQAEVWDLSYLEKAADSLKSGGILVTYCAQGAFRRNLETLGFRTERLPGPPGKKEMIRARLIR